MALHLMQSFMPAVNYEEGAAALAGILARRNCRMEPVTSHTASAFAELRAAVGTGTRLFTQFSFVEAGGIETWVLDETPAGFELWDPLLARELSAELGGFAVSMEASRNLGRLGYAVFFAGRTIEFTSEDPYRGRFDAGRLPSDESTATRIERVYPTFTDLYTLLSGSPASGLLWERGTHLSSLVVNGCPCEVAWHPHAEDETPLALVVFALAEEQEFTKAWQELGAMRPPGWHWRATATTSSQIPYVLLTRDGGLDIALCDALARRLDVPAAAVALHTPGGAFDWWNAQPGMATRHGQALGAAEFVQRLMPATVALGERPGIMRVRL
jgi:hypothetical protein